MPHIKRENEPRELTQLLDMLGRVACWMEKQEFTVDLEEARDTIDLSDDIEDLLEKYRPSVLNPP